MERFKCLNNVVNPVTSYYEDVAHVEPTDSFVTLRSYLTKSMRVKQKDSSTPRLSNGFILEYVNNLLLYYFYFRKIIFIKCELLWPDLVKFNFL